MVFAQVAGPLTWSIVALRNSLVLHSLDKVMPVIVQEHQPDVRVPLDMLSALTTSFACSPRLLLLK